MKKEQLLEMLKLVAGEIGQLDSELIPSEPKEHENISGFWERTRILLGIKPKKGSKSEYVLSFKANNGIYEAIIKFISPDKVEFTIAKVTVLARPKKGKLTKSIYCGKITVKDDLTTKNALVSVIRRRLPELKKFVTEHIAP